MKTHIIFDLDGTLTDSQEGITNCVRYALESFGIHETDYSRLCLFIGPPLDASFKEFYGFSDEDAQKAVKKYRERFETVGLFENRPYDGIVDMLRLLKDSGRVLCVATSKPEKFSRRILDHFGMTPYLDCILGNSMHLQVEKSDMIKKIVDLYGISKEQAVMVGDRRFDVEAAHKAGVDCIGVSYGFAPEGELEKAGADHIVDTVPRLTEQLLRQYVMAPHL